MPQWTYKEEIEFDLVYKTLTPFDIGRAHVALQNKGLNKTREQVKGYYKGYVKRGYQIKTHKKRKVVAEISSQYSGELKIIYDNLNAQTDKLVTVTERMIEFAKEERKGRRENLVEMLKIHNEYKRAKLNQMPPDTAEDEDFNCKIVKLALPNVPTSSRPRIIPANRATEQDFFPTIPSSTTASASTPSTTASIGPSAPSAPSSASSSTSSQPPSTPPLPSCAPSSAPSNPTTSNNVPTNSATFQVHLAALSASIHRPLGLSTPKEK